MAHVSLSCYYFFFILIFVKREFRKERDRLSYCLILLVLSLLLILFEVCGIVKSGVRVASGKTIGVMPGFHIAHDPL
jgi:hypothetical protein